MLQPYNITGAIEIEANGQDSTSNMPNSEVAQNLTFSNCSRISVLSLVQSFFLAVTGNPFDEFNGAPLLREVDGGLASNNNQNMTRIAFPKLQTVAGGFTVANNSRLTALDELYSLETIAGAISFEWPLDTYVATLWIDRQP